MKILHINTFSNGGAAVAALNLHKGLLEKGVDSTFLYFLGAEINIPQCYRINNTLGFVERLFFKLKIKKHFWEKESETNTYKKFKDHSFTLNYSDFDLLKSDQRDLILQADVIHLHWINYTLNVKTVSRLKKKKIVWTLHDMNPFTGGCHYAYSCEGYLKDCGSCPQLLPPANTVVAKQELRAKNKSIKHVEMTIVALNQWMFSLSRLSFLFGKFQHTIIPNSLDASVFKPSDRFEKNIPNDLKNKKVYGYVAAYHSELKGSDIFLGLVELFEKNTTIEFAYIGKEFEKQKSNIVYKGNLQSNEELAEFYNSIDFLLVPSRGDNMPNVIIEALCCGVPVIGSGVGGIPELIAEENGIVVGDMLVNSWAEIVKRTSESSSFDRSAISANAREKYNQNIQSESMIRLYAALIGHSTTQGNLLA